MSSYVLFDQLKSCCLLLLSMYSALVPIDKHNAEQIYENGEANAIADALERKSEAGSKQKAVIQQT